MQLLITEILFIQSVVIKRINQLNCINQTLPNLNTTVIRGAK